MYFFAYQESDESKKAAYILGRLLPRRQADYSQLTLRLPSQKKESTTCQIQSFLTSRKNLNALFDSMEKTSKMNELTNREKQLKSHLNAFVNERYQLYLKRTHQQECDYGRVPGFTMEELGEMPKSELPPPIILNKHSAKDVLDIFRKDVKQVVSVLLIC